MKLFGRPLQFSLKSLLLLSLFIGALMPTVLYWNQPWVRVGSTNFTDLAKEPKTPLEEFLDVKSRYVFRTSPDGCAIVRSARKVGIRWQPTVRHFEFQDVKTGQIVERVIPGIMDSLPLFSPTDSSIIFSLVGSTEYNEWAIWNWRTGAIVSRIQLYGQIVTSAEFSNDGNRLVTAARNTQLWNVNGKLLAETTRDDGWPDRIVKFSGDDHLIASQLNEGGEISLLDGNTLKPLGELGRISTERPIVFFPSEGACAMLLEKDRLLKIDVSTQRELWSHSIKHQRNGTTYWITGIFSSSDRIAVSVREDDEPRLRQSVQILDSKDGRLLTSIPVGSEHFACYIVKNGDLWIDNGTQPNMTRYTRRFPEWWWGHFYRPEVWFTALFGGLWFWQVIQWWRRRA